MKKILFLFFLAFNLIASATTYYVSSSGNDLANGFTESTPWNTISKVNAAFAIMNPGDKILFKRGDTFYGTLNISKSGLAGSSIVIGAYGVGSEPVFTGFATLSSWTNEGNGIYSTRLSGVTRLEMVIIDGKQYWMGQYPNTGFLTYESFNANLSITDNNLPSTPSWTGAEVFIRKNFYTTNRATITDHSGQTLTYSEIIKGNTVTLKNNFGYIIQNHIRTLTDFGDWWYDVKNTKFYMYFGADSPQNHLIKATLLEDLIYINGKSYITIENINLYGSNKTGINAESVKNLTISNCKLEYIGYKGLSVVWNTTSSNITVDNSEFKIINGHAAEIWANYVVFTNNIIDSIGLIRGACYGSNTGKGLYGMLDNALIQYNQISNTGHHGISPIGNNFLVINNFLHHNVFEYLDAGAIYISHTGSSYSGQVIKNNIVLNAIGGNWGTNNWSSPWMRAEGIYLDSYNDNVTVDGNTVANCNQGIVLNESQGTIVKNNTVYNNAWQFFLNNMNSKTPLHPLRGISLSNNIVFAKDSEQLVLRFNTPENDIKLFGTSDNNFWLRPLDDDDVFNIYQPSTGSKSLTLAGWQSFTGQDANSHKSPVNITDVNNIRFEYNVAKTNKVIALEKPMIDARGVKYQSAITLLPYTSAVLMVDPNPSLPAIPAYSGSVIENTTPARLEMTYSLTLANIVPAPSAFIVKVNSVTRTINTVTISGTKVLLTLASPVVSGDNITVAYTKPAVNPLQTASGGLAVSITAQPVTNKVGAVEPVYVSSAIENATPDRLEMTYNLTLTNIIPAASAFTVRVNSVTRTINTVTISGTKVLLTLASPVVSGDNITVAYTKPAVNPLQTASGGQAASVTAQPVTNNVGSVRPVYVSSVIENASPDILQITFNLNLAGIIPPPSAFSVRVNSVTRTVSTVAISGTKVLLTLSSPVVSGDVVIVAYTIPATNALRATTGYWALSIPAQPVINNVDDDIRPVYISSVVENASPGILEVTYSLNLANIVPPASAFTVLVNSVTRNVNTVAITGTKVLLTLSNPVVSGDVITVAYTIPETDALRSTTGFWSLSMTGQPVTNNVDEAVRPEYVSSVIENAASNILEVSFSLNLVSIAPPASAFSVKVNSVTRTVNAVAVSGTEVLLTLSSPVVSGDNVTVAYTVPATNALRSALGWFVLSFSSKPVTNNVNIAIRPEYVNSVIENADPDIIEVTFNLNLSSEIPPASAFNVVVNSVTRTVNKVTLYGTKVLLTLSSPVVSGDNVTVSYTIPSTNALRSATGWFVLSFNEQPVTNNVDEAVRPEYVNSVVENTAPDVLEVNFSLYLANIVPPASSFGVIVNSVTRTVSRVSISGTKVLLTLASPVVLGDLITVTYTIPATNALRSATGWWSLSFGPYPVTNNVNEAVRPSYISSVVEDATPGMIEMTYNITLASVVSPTSAFTVRVNSAARTINTVSISGPKVLLTLASPVLYGDVVTVSYTIPATNALRATTGYWALSMSAQPVLNNCTNSSKSDVSNVLSVNYETSTFSGFVYEIEALKSFNQNDDDITYEWTVPSDLPVSITNGPKLRFLSPVYNKSEVIELKLTASDGMNKQSTTLPINIIPYKPELYIAKIIKTEASDHRQSDTPDNITDANLETYWSVEGDNQWIILTLSNPVKISHLQMAFLHGQKFETYFDIYASKDNIIWSPILINAASCDFSGDMQVFDFPASEKDEDYSFIKVVGHGNSLNSWNYFSEINIFANATQNTISPSDNQTIFIYPNPARDFVNIFLKEPVNERQILKIFDLHGKICLESRLDQGISEIQVPLNLKPGYYVAKVMQGTLTVFTQKLIVGE